MTVEVFLNTDAVFPVFLLMVGFFLFEFGKTMLFLSFLEPVLDLISSRRSLDTDIDGEGEKSPRISMDD